MTFKRRDRNHADIREGLRQVGVFVLDLADMGKGVPDLLTVWERRVKLLEVKMPGEKLTPDEEEFHAKYTGDIAIVYSKEQAIQEVRG